MDRLKRYLADARERQRKVMELPTERLCDRAREGHDLGRELQSRAEAAERARIEADAPRVVSRIVGETEQQYQASQADYYGSRVRPVMDRLRGASRELRGTKQDVESATRSLARLDWREGRRENELRLLVEEFGQTCKSADAALSRCRTALGMVKAELRRIDRHLREKR